MRSLAYWVAILLLFITGCVCLGAGNVFGCAFVFLSYFALALWAGGDVDAGVDA